MDNKIITDKLFIKKLKLYVSCSHVDKGYEIVCPIGDINYYLCTDGSIREFAWLYHKEVAFYATKELAHEALDRFNKKEAVMKKQDLKTGMVVVTKDGCTGVVQLGTQNGDVIVLKTGSRGFHYIHEFTDDLCSDQGYSKYDIIEVYGNANTDTILDGVKGTLLWTRPVSVTTMTISEIQEKLGIDNLHITE